MADDPLQGPVFPPTPPIPTLPKPRPTFSAPRPKPTPAPDDPLQFYDTPTTKAADPAAAAVSFYDQSGNGRLSTSVDLAHTVKPDAHAEALKLADRTGLPIDFISRNIPEVQREADRRDFNADQFRRTSPALADWLQNPDHAMVSGDDHTVLQKLELQIQSIAQAWRQGTVQGDLGDEAVALRAQAARAAGGADNPLTPEQASQLAMIDQAEGYFANESQGQGALAYGVRTTAALARGLLGFARAGAVPGMVGGALAGAAAVAAGQPEAVVPAVKTGIAVGGAAGTYKYAFDQSMGSAFREFSAITDESGRPLDPQIASIASAGVGAVNAALNLVGERVLLKLVPGAEQFLNASPLGVQDAVKMALTKPTFRMALLEAGKSWLHSGTINGALGAAQELVTILGREGAEEASGGTFAPQPAGADVGRVKSGGLAGVVGGLGVGAILSTPRLAMESAAVRNANIVVDQFKALGETVKESKTAERLPSAVQDLVQHAVNTHDAPENVFVDIGRWQTLFQTAPAGAAEEAATQILGSPDQYREAVASGGDLVIPLSQYTAKVAGTPLGDRLMPEIRIRQGDLSQREAEEAAKTMESAAGPVADEAILTPAQKAAQSFQTGMEAQLRDAGASPAEAEAQAAVPTAFFRTLGERVGQNLFDRYRINVARRETIPEAQQPEQPSAAEAPRAVLPEPSPDPVGYKRNVQKYTDAELLRRYEDTHTRFESVYAISQQVGQKGMGTLKDFRQAQKFASLRQGHDSAYLIKLGDELRRRGIDPDQFLYERQQAREAVPSEFDLSPADKAAFDAASERAAIQDEAKGGTVDVARAYKRSILSPDVPFASDATVLFQRKIDPNLRVQIEQYYPEASDQAVNIILKYKGDIAAALNSLPFDDARGTGFKSDKAMLAEELDNLQYDDNGKLREPITLKSNAELLGSEPKGDADGTPAERELFQAWASLDKIDAREGRRTTKPDPAELAVARQRLLDAETNVQREKDGLPPIQTPVELPDVPGPGGPTLEEFTAQMRARLGEAGLKQGEKTLETVVGTAERGTKAVTANGTEVELAHSGMQSSAGKTVSTLDGGQMDKSAIAKIVDKNGNVLWERGQPSTAKGAIQFSGAGPIREFNISLLPTADRSTFLHETGHLFLEVMSDLADQPAVAEDMQVIRDWVGNDGTPFTEAQHEQFARGIEAYLLEGKAPSAPLRTAFARFRTWLVAIYRELRNLNVTLTPEVRSTMDRLLASEDEITAAQQAQRYEPLKQADLGATAAEYAAYRRSTDRATEAAQTGLVADLLKEERRESTAFWQAETERTRAAVASVLEADPAYQALNYLQTGALLEGASEEQKLAFLETEPVKLDRGILAHRYGETILTELPGGAKGEGKRVWVAEGGVDPDELAPHFGFESGDELVQALLEKKGKPLDGPTGEIERQTQAQMRANHPTLLGDSARLAQAAQAEVHRGEQTNVLLTELKMLGKRRGQRLPPNIDAVREQARAIVGRKSVRDLSPSSYQSAEARNAKLTEDALAKGDFAAAAEFKRKQLLNHLAYKIATDLQEKSAKSAEYLNDMGTDRVTAMLTKAGGSYLEQRDKLLERFDFARRSLKTVDRNTSLAEWIDEQKALGRQPQISADLQAEAYRTNWKNLTPDQLFDLRDAVRQIVHLARTKNLLIAEQKGREIQAAVTDMATSIMGFTKHPKTAPLGALTGKERLAANFDAFIAWHTKLGIIVRNLDGNQDNGAVFRNFLAPIEEAQNHEATRMQREGAKTDAIFKRYYTAAENTTMARFERAVVPGAEEAGMLSHWDRLLIALNAGTADNLKKLIDGSTLRLTESGVQAVINSLAKRDMEYVQAIWDQIGSYWEEIKAKQERVTGLAPEKVEPQVVHTRFGDYAGGYFPIVYDSERSPIAYGHEMAEMADVMKRTGYGNSTTARGHTINRVESAGIPLRLDPAIIYRHQMQVIHDLTHHEMLIDANRLLRHEEFRSAILANAGPKVYREMQLMLGDIATGSTIPITPGDRLTSWLRQGSVSAMLGWNVVTGLIHVSGLANGIVRIGADRVAQGMNQWLRSGPAGQEHTLAWIRDKSEFMNERAGNIQRDLREALIRIQAPGVFSDAKASYYSLIGKVVLMTDIPIWLGAYQKAVDTLKPDDFSSPEAMEHHASLLADQAVRDSKGGGLLVDQARVERGGQGQKLWTTFYTYGAARFNQNRELLHRTDFTSPKSAGAFMVDALMLNVVPIVLIGALKAALKGQAPDEKELAKETAAALLDQLIYVRELVQPIMTGEYKGPAGMRIIGATADLAAQIGQKKADAAFWKALNMEGGLLFHYPALQAQRSAQGAYLLFSGKTQNPFALISGGPTKPH